MNERQTFLCGAIARQRALILEVERYLWRHPETGFREWNSHRYLKEKMEKLGFSVTEAGNIPGFYADFDTGRPGPRVLAMAELDALLCPDHPEAVDGKAHACGHNGQCAALVGLAAALREPGAADGLFGSVRLMFVPAEELIELEYREDLRRAGTIRWRTGKPEFLSRGMMDGCDMAFLFHGICDDSVDFAARGGGNGCLTKSVVYRGKGSHAGAAPEKGINALYAAALGMQAVNAVRETFADKDHIRVHPILTEGGSSVNIIPERARLESYVRGASLQAILDASKKTDRALAGAAVSLGAQVEVCDRAGYTPLHNDPTMLSIVKRCMTAISPSRRVRVDPSAWNAGSTDIGDLSAVMPVVHPYAAGASGSGHGTDYRIADPERACVNSAKCQLLFLDALLSDDAKEARRVIARAKPPYPSKEAFLTALDALQSDRSLVAYNGDGSVRISL